jgi:AcrR family transcriptional regulator
MKAKSALLAGRQDGTPARRRARATEPAASEPRRRKATARLPAQERREQILTKAYEFFSEYGLTAQTRALAEACGVSQRLLYSIFPNKASLIQAVYERNIAGPFKAVWLVQLQNRAIPLEERLCKFYVEYYQTVLTRGWLRLFLYSSLAEAEIAPTYIGEIIKRLLQTIAEEAAFDSGAPLPTDPALAQEIGWVLHGNISHLGIRRQVYRDTTPVPVERVIALHVKAFLAAYSAGPHKDPCA